MDDSRLYDQSARICHFWGGGSICNELMHPRYCVNPNRQQQRHPAHKSPGVLNSIFGWFDYVMLLQKSRVSGYRLNVTVYDQQNKSQEVMGVRTIQLES